jgi:hypothetical protein
MTNIPGKTYSVMDEGMIHTPELTVADLGNLPRGPVEARPLRNPVAHASWTRYGRALIDRVDILTQPRWICLAVTLLTSREE